MLIEPRASRIIARVCDTLEQLASADMSGTYAQRQVMDGVRLLRDISMHLEGIAGMVKIEIVEMERVLEDHGASVPPAPCDDEDLFHRHLQLQARLEELQQGRSINETTARHDLPAIRRELRRFYLTILEKKQAEVTPRFSG